MTYVSRTVSDRYEFDASQILKTVVDRHESRMALDSLVADRSTLLFPVSSMSHDRQSILVEVFRTTADRSSVLPSSYDIVWKEGVVAANVTPSIVMTAWSPTNSQQIQSRAFSCDITLRESAPSSWAVSFADPEGVFNPEHPGTSFSNLMTDDPYEYPIVGYARKFIFDYNVDGVGFHYVGVPDDYDYELDVQTQGYSKFGWQGSGISAVLHRPEQTMSTVISTARQIYCRKELIQQIAATYGVSIDLNAISDKVVAYLDRQKAMPMDWIVAMLEMTWEAWTEVGETVVCYPPAPKPKEQADWVLDYSTTPYLRSVSGQGRRNEPITKVVMSRALPAGNVLATIDLYEYGIYNASWSGPADGVWFHMSVPGGGRVTNIFMRDVNDNVVGIFGDVNGEYPVGLSQTNNIKSVSFTWGACSPNDMSGRSSGQVEWTGKMRATRESPIDQGGVYVAERYSTSLRSHPDARPKEFSVNPIFANGADLCESAEKFLARVASFYRPRKYVLDQLHVQLRIGDTVREIIPAPISVDRAIRVREIVHHFTDDETAGYTEFQGTEIIAGGIEVA